MTEQITTDSGELVDFATLREKFGVVLFRGNAYWLTRQADFSNRQFPGSWFDAQEGDEYTVEFECRAVDAKGNEYTIYWQFDGIVKGQEPEMDGYDWDDKNIVRAKPL